MSTLAGQSTNLDRSNPFAGLRSFEEGDQEFFLGRDHEIGDLYRRVCNNKTTICFGRSGLGKSSLMLAGLFPRLRMSGYFPVLVRLGYGESDQELADQVFTQTAVTGRKHGVDVPAFTEGESLWEWLQPRMQVGIAVVLRQQDLERNACP